MAKKVAGDYIHRRKTLPLYPVEYEVIAGPDFDTLIDVCELSHPGLDLGHVSTKAGYCVMIHNKDTGINRHVLLINTSTPDTERFVVHECSHTTFNMLEELGIKVGPDNNEAFAYVMEEVYDQTMKIINKLNAPCKK